jgi:hypothetical protein
MAHKDDSDINEILLSLNFRVVKNEKMIGAALVNMDQRTFLISEFVDNDYFSNMESLILQLNNQSAQDSRFKIIVNMPPDVTGEKVEEIFKLCEVDYQMGNKKDFNASGIS